MSRTRAASSSGLPPNLVEVLQDSFIENDYVSTVRQALVLLAGADPESEPVDPKAARKLFALALQAVQDGALADATQTELNTHASFATVFLGFVYVISSAARGRVQDKEIAEDLKKICLPDACQNEFAAAYAAKRTDLEAAAIKKRIVLPSLDRMDWRVDVAITTTHLVRAFKPTVTFQVTTTDGRIHTFESSVDKFHQLRFNVARVLAAMQNIEEHPTLKRLVD